MAVHLDSVAMEIAGIEVGMAEQVLASEFSVTGRVSFDEDRVSHLGPRTEGYVQDIPGELGADVVPGELLAVLESPEVGARRADLSEARLILQIAEENFERQERLEAQGISSRRELLDAEAELRRSQASVQRASERLIALGASEGEGAEFTLRAPYAGVIVEKHATRGEIVAPTDRLFTVADLSNLWIELDIYERDLPKVREGQSVTVTTSAYPNELFEGIIVYLADILDAERRTVHARVEVENRNRMLRPGMFATASVALPEGTPVVALPRDAVQSVEGTDVVWVPGEEPGEFVGRPVLTGQELPGDRIEILSGLAVDEPVVLSGAFTLKSEHEEGEFGGHAH
jgi:cobalt-zinc-cadmium efflux system membrane fusion protein